jgi:hypothetical protein
MTFDKAFRSLDRLIAGDPRNGYRIERRKTPELCFHVRVSIWRSEYAAVPVIHEGKDPLLTRAIWDVLNIASPRTI